MRIIVMASGVGSNFEAIIKEFDVVGLIVDRDCGAVDIARRYDVDVYKVRDMGDTLLILSHLQPDLICLAGYLKILPAELIECFKGRIINIHPSLLPKFRGLDAFESSYACDDVLGVTVHYVDSGVDTGEIIEQRSFKNSFDYEEMLRELKVCEHELYTDVIKKIEVDYEKCVNKCV